VYAVLTVGGREIMTGNFGTQFKVREPGAEIAEVSYDLAGREEVSMAAADTAAVYAGDTLRYRVAVLDVVTGDELDIPVQSITLYRFTGAETGEILASSAGIGPDKTISYTIPSGLADGTYSVYAVVSFAGITVKTANYSVKFKADVQKACITGVNYDLTGRQTASNFDADTVIVYSGDTLTYTLGIFDSVTDDAIDVSVQNIKLYTSGDVLLGEGFAAGKTVSYTVSPGLAENTYSVYASVILSGRQINTPLFGIKFKVQKPSVSISEVSYGLVGRDSVSMADTDTAAVYAGDTLTYTIDTDELDIQLDSISLYRRTGENTGILLASSGSVGADKNISYTVPLSLADGTYSVYAVVSLTGLTVQTPDYPVMFKVQKPSVSISEVSYGLVGRDSVSMADADTAAVYAGDTLTYTIDTDELDIPADSIKLYRRTGGNAGVLLASSGSVDAGKTISYTIPSSLADGTYSVYAVVSLTGFTVQTQDYPVMFKVGAQTVKITGVTFGAAGGAQTADTGAGASVVYAGDRLVYTVGVFDSQNDGIINIPVQKIELYAGKQASQFKLAAVSSAAGNGIAYAVPANLEAGEYEVYADVTVAGRGIQTAVFNKKFILSVPAAADPDTQYSLISSQSQLFIGSETEVTLKKEAFGADIGRVQISFPDNLELLSLTADGSLLSASGYSVIRSGGVVRIDAQFDPSAQRIVIALRSVSDAVALSVIDAVVFADTDGDLGSPYRFAAHTAVQLLSLAESPVILDYAGSGGAMAATTDGSITLYLSGTKLNFINMQSVVYTAEKPADTGGGIDARIKIEKFDGGAVISVLPEYRDSGDFDAVISLLSYVVGGKLVSGSPLSAVTVRFAAAPEPVLDVSGFTVTAELNYNFILSYEIIKGGGFISEITSGNGTVSVDKSAQFSFIPNFIYSDGVCEVTVRIVLTVTDAGKYYGLAFVPEDITFEIENAYPELPGAVGDTRSDADGLTGVIDMPALDGVTVVYSVLSGAEYFIKAPGGTDNSFEFKRSSAVQTAVIGIAVSSGDGGSVYNYSYNLTNYANHDFEAEVYISGLNGHISVSSRTLPSGYFTGVMGFAPDADSESLIKAGSITAGANYLKFTLTEFNVAGRTLSGTLSFTAAGRAYELAIEEELESAADFDIVLADGADGGDVTFTPVNVNGDVSFDFEFITSLGADYFIADTFISENVIDGALSYTKIHKKQGAQITIRVIMTYALGTVEKDIQIYIGPAVPKIVFDGDTGGVFNDETGKYEFTYSVLSGHGETYALTGDEVYYNDITVIGDGIYIKNVTAERIGDTVTVSYEKLVVPSAKTAQILVKAKIAAYDSYGDEELTARKIVSVEATEVTLEEEEGSHTNGANMYYDYVLSESAEDNNWNVVYDYEYIANETAIEGSMSGNRFKYLYNTLAAVTVSLRVTAKIYVGGELLGSVTTAENTDIEITAAAAVGVSGVAKGGSGDNARTISITFSLPAGVSLLASTGSVASQAGTYSLSPITGATGNVTATFKDLARYYFGFGNQTATYNGYIAIKIDRGDKYTAAIRAEYVNATISGTQFNN
jgi:hypothetical protein